MKDLFDRPITTADLQQKHDQAGPPRRDAQRRFEPKPPMNGIDDGTTRQYPSDSIQTVDENPLSSAKRKFGPTNDQVRHPQGNLFRNLDHDSDQRNTEKAERSNPQPGHPEWNRIERIWEQKLKERGLDVVMRVIAKDFPERYRELKHGINFSKTRPAGGEDVHAHQPNPNFNTAIPTVALKLTEQHFGRPVSPLGHQELLISEQGPEAWSNHGEESNSSSSISDKAQYGKDEPEMLEAYQEKGYGQKNPRSKITSIGRAYLDCSTDVQSNQSNS